MVMPTEPSTIGRAGPRTSSGRISWTTSRNSPASAMSTKIAVCVSGHSPLRATTALTATMSAQPTTRTTRS